jgi:hypothetical protein
MDRYDEVLEMLRSARGMSVETALKIKADDTLLVLVGPHSDRMADLEALCLNDDGSQHTPPAEMAALIEEYFPQAIAPAQTWRARAKWVAENS